jgi:periplasmic copper chaperone A
MSSQKSQRIVWASQRGLLGAALLVAAVPSAALAHSGPSPSTLVVGSTTKVIFTVGHGCGKSPTVKVRMKAPAGFVIGAASGPKGWTATTKGLTVTWTGPAAPADKKLPLTVSLTAPKKTGNFAFPIIQDCKVGSLAWTELKVPGEDEPERPAPMIKVTAKAK